jgi:hypothetical protein
VQVEQRAGRGPPGVAPGPQHRGGGEALGGQRLVEDAAHGGGVALRRGVLDQEAGAPVVDQVVSPPTAEATTGVPQAAASSATRPNDSERLGTMHTSAAR